MLISEIKPIDEKGINLLKRDDAKDVINKIIEPPLRKACSIFMKKGIRTLMSSANKNNVLKQGEKPVEKEDLFENRIITDPAPMFDEVGKGYAWIMIDFNSLSDENKDWLFSLEERTDENNVRIGEKGIWFVQPCEIGNIRYCLQTGQYDYEFLRSALSEEEISKIPKNVQFDKRLAEFYNRHVVLAYNWAMYSLQSVVLRMPVNEQTTLEQVEEYFATFAEGFRDQIKENKKEEPEGR
ncbi:MAG: hypothetical protein ACI4UU_01750 [Clostridia bacterium]